MIRIFTSLPARVAAAAIALCAFSAQQASAIPAPRRPFTVTQPDGTVLTLMKTGDERGHFTIDLKGNLVTGNEETGYFFADIDSRGAVVSSGISASSTPSDRFDAATLIPRAMELRATRRAKAPARAHEAATTDAKDPDFRMVMCDFPTSGNLKTLVVLVEFSNLKFNIANPRDYFDRLLNEDNFSENGSIGSAKQYFRQSSAGQFDPDFVVVGPVVLPKDYSYYGKNDYMGYDANVAEMVTEACKGCDDQVNFADFDYDNDGMIDNVYFFYAGYGEADNPETAQYTNTIWPHASNVKTDMGITCELDGKLLNHYACSNERRGVYSDNPGMTVGYGTFCHEFGHVLGLPDIYDPYYKTDQSGNLIYYTPGSWMIMDSGGYNHDGCVPPLYGAFERFSLGWVKPRQFGATKEYTISPIGEKNEVFIVYTEVPSEFFLFENRQMEGFDRYLPHHGMLVWHIDFKQDKWNYNSVNSQAHQYVDLVEANGMSGTLTNPYQEAARRRGEPFPGSLKASAFSATTTPALVSWKKNPTIISLNGISEDNGIIRLNAVNAENPTDIDPSGVDGIEADGNTLRVLTAPGRIMIMEGKADVYDLTGRKIGVVAPDCPVETAPGTYIVSEAGRTVKTIVR